MSTGTQHDLESFTLLFFKRDFPVAWADTEFT